MIKSKFISMIGRRHPNLAERDIALCINLLLEQMSDSLSKGGRIEVRGFGSFSLHYRPPRNAHNPRTGERVITNGKHSPHFKPGKALRDSVNAAGQAGVPIVVETESDEEE